MLTKNLYRILMVVFTVALMVRCSEDSIAPETSGFQVEDMDLIQVTNGAPFARISFGAKSSDMKNVKITLTNDANPEIVISNTLREITHSTLNRVVIDVPFGTPDVAPSGVYNVAVSVNGESDGASNFKVHVLNNQTIQYCDAFPAPVAGKANIFVTIPGGAAITDAGKDVFIVGDFMDENGAAGDWNPGNPDFKLTKLSDQCYYIVLDKFDAGKNFKFTLGDWPLEFLGPKGEGMDNQVSPGGTEIKLTVYNFKTLPVTAYDLPEELPATSIKSGKVTALFDINDEDVAATYYLVEKGATTVEGVTKMDRVTGTTRFAGLIDKNTAKEYVIVKGDAETVGKNAYGFEQTISWDGASNPVRSSVISFGAEPDVMLDKVFVVGGATPGGWDNPVPTPSQEFTKTAEGKYTLTVALNASQGYLFLPVNGSWSVKWGNASGGPLTGSLRYAGGSDLMSPEEAGNYKIDIDFTKGLYGTYTLTKQ